MSRLANLLGRLPRPWIIALALVALLLLARLFAAPAGESELKATVRIDLSSPVGQFFPNLLGHNLMWTDRADGLLVETDGQNPVFNPGVIAALRQMSVPLIRFPGGALASTYTWKVGIGPVSARGLGRDFTGVNQPMLFGTGEFLALLRLVGAGGLITLNLKRDPAEAAAWLTYVQQSGASVSYWEVGNESFLPQDPSYMKADHYISKYLALRQALKAVNPAVKTGPLLEGSIINTGWGSHIVPELSAWNQKVVGATAGQAEFYSTHLYAPLARGKNDLATARALAAAPEALGRNLASLMALIKSRAGTKELWVSEFNVTTDNDLANWRFGTSLGQAGYITSLLMTMVRQQISGANYWSLLGNHNFGMIKKAGDPRWRPGGLAYQLLAPLSGAQAVLTEVNAPNLSYPEIGNVTAGLAPKVIEAQAFFQSGMVHLVLVNRDPETQARVTWKFSGARIPAAGSVGLKMLTGPDILAGNEESNRVRLEEVQLQTQAPGQLEVLLPPGALARVWARLEGAP